MNCHCHTLCLDVGLIVMIHVGVCYSYPRLVAGYAIPC